MPPNVETALKPYRAKRRFDATSEPAGGATPAAGARYLIQKHAARRLHYDFRLELDGVLLSWAVTRGPSYATKDKRLAVRTEDHPLEYGDFEGNIPPGNYGAGTVMLWDTGTWAALGDPHQGLADGKLAFVLNGERLRGRWALVRMRPDPKAEKARRENWLLIKESDEFANTQPDLLEDNLTSAVSGRRFDQIAKADTVWHAQNHALPPFQAPMLATLVEAPPRGAGWMYEIKYDGYRALIAANQQDVKIYTRSGLDWTAKFPAIAKAVAALRLDRALLDGEIVVIDREGRTDFAALVAALEAGKGALSCFVFDLLHSAGRDLRGEKLSVRKAALKKLLGARGKSDVIQVSEEFSGQADSGEKLLKTACAHGLEGLVAKRESAPYRSGRHPAWLKIKCGQDQEFVIIGFAPSARGRGFASILLAVREEDALRYAGRVGSGFSDADLARLAWLRDQHKISAPACGDVPKAQARGVIWVKPALVAQVEFAGWTGGRKIRHGRFKGLRDDKSPREVVREMPKLERAAPIRGVEITHGERLVYPEDGVTKAELAAYVQRAAPFMLPFIEDRFVSFVRCPGGAEQKCFFQRHPMAGLGEAWLTREYTHNGHAETYMFCKTPEALAQAVQMGVVEFHIWGTKAGAIEKPDRIVFDLDPDEALAFDAVRDAAFRLRDVLAALDLQSLPLLSGGKGIHVVVPVQPRHAWPVVKQFAGNLASRVAADAPDRFVATMAKARRKGKIFIDYFRNDVTATAIAPYSPRARKGASVAWPVSWAGLRASQAPNGVTIRAADAALAAGENAWAEYGQIKQSLSKGALRALGVDA